MRGSDPGDVHWGQVAERLRDLEPVVLQEEFKVALRHAALLCDLRGRLRKPRTDDTPTLVAGLPRVCIESPLRGDYERNILYADACMLDAIGRDEAPYLGHLLYPRVLDDADVHDRMCGISAHIAWMRAADLVAVYIDLGVTEGMHAAIRVARERKIQVVERTLGLGWMEPIAHVKPTQGF